MSNDTLAKHAAAPSSSANPLKSRKYFRRYYYSNAITVTEGSVREQYMNGRAEQWKQSGAFRLDFALLLRTTAIKRTERRWRLASVRDHADVDVDDRLIRSCCQ